MLDMAEELAELGMSPEAIDQWQDNAEAALDAAPVDDEDDGVLVDNVPALQVLQHCQWELISGPSAVRYAGISATEISAVMGLLDIPPADRARVLGDVRYCVHVALPILNRE